MSGYRFDGTDDFVNIDPSATQGVHGDVTLTNITAEDDPIGTAMPGIDMYGHQLIINDESIECMTCEMEEEIPEIFKMSSGFYEVVYKLYIFGKFKHENCHASIDGTGIEDLADPVDMGGGVQYDPNRVKWVGGDTYTTNGQDVTWTVPEGQRFMLNGKEYVYHGSGKFVDATTGAAHDLAELQHMHGQDASYQIADIGQMQQNYQRDSLSLGDSISIDGAQTQLDQAQQPDVTVQGDNLTEQAEQTLKEKAAKALKDKRNSLIR